MFRSVTIHIYLLEAQNFHPSILYYKFIQIQLYNLSTFQLLVAVLYHDIQ